MHILVRAPAHVCAQGRAPWQRMRAAFGRLPARWRQLATLCPDPEQAVEWPCVEVGAACEPARGRCGLL